MSVHTFAPVPKSSAYPLPSFAGVNRARLQRKCSCRGQEKCKSCSPRSRRTAIEWAPESTHEVLKKPGAPLTASVRDDFEARFGRPLPDVRIHTDHRAGESAREVSAEAYTVGQHIVFSPGAYDPQTSSGLQLLAHELVHTLQQRSASNAAGPLRVTTEHEPAEHEAALIAAKMASRTGSPGPISAPVHVARQQMQRRLDPPEVSTKAPQGKAPATEIPSFSILDLILASLAANDFGTPSISASIRFPVIISGIPLWLKVTLQGKGVNCGENGVRRFMLEGSINVELYRKFGELKEDTHPEVKGRARNSPKVPNPAKRGELIKPKKLAGKRKVRKEKEIGKDLLTTDTTCPTPKVEVGGKVFVRGAIGVGGMFGAQAAVEGKLSRDFTHGTSDGLVWDFTFGVNSSKGAVVEFGGALEGKFVVDVTDEVMSLK